MVGVRHGDDVRSECRQDTDLIRRQRVAVQEHRLPGDERSRAGFHQNVPMIQTTVTALHPRLAEPNA
jgi:hypothetical protein